MLKTNSPGSFSEIDDSSAVTGEVSGSEASDGAPIRAVLDYLEKGERNFLTPADLAEMAGRPTAAEIAAALTLAPGVNTERPALDRERPAATTNSPQKNSRVEHRASRTGANGAHRMPRPFALVPTLSKPSSLFLKTPARVPLMGVRIDCVTERQVTAHVISSIRAGVGGWIATPNVQHLRVISEQPELLRLVNEANFRVADGMPLLWASRLQGTPLPERITGAGLTLSLAAAAAKAGSSIFLLGGDPGDAEAAASVLKRLNPDLKIAGVIVSCARFRARPAPDGGNRQHTAFSQTGSRLLVLRISETGVGDPRSPRVLALRVVSRIGRKPRDRFGTHAAGARLDSGHRHGMGVATWTGTAATLSSLHRERSALLFQAAR